MLIGIRERGRETERETSIGCLLHVPEWDWTHNPGMCPERESNLRPFGLLGDAPNQLSHIGLCSYFNVFLSSVVLCTWVCFGWSDASAHAIWIQVVFLDDMGSNLKPARALGMITILVHDSDVALQELEKVTGMQVTVCALRQISCPSSACRYTRQNKRRIWLSGSSLLRAWLSCAGLLGGSSLPVSQSSRCPWRTSCSFRCSQWTEKQCSGSKNLY